MIETHEGGTQFEHSLDHALEFFSKAGSLFEKRGSFYQGDESCLSLFQKTWIVDEELSFQLLLWLRDCRGGAGNRSGFRTCLAWLAGISPQWITRNIAWIPEVGRWDDLRAAFGTSVEPAAVDCWAKAVRDNNVLAAKWADRKDKPLKHALGFKEEGKFRKFLARVRKNHIVEHKMSTRRWNEIEYHTVPSLAMARYAKAFGRHDWERFAGYKARLESGQDTVHADVLFPHDCVRAALSGDAAIADAQFEALPNYMGDEKAVVVCDTSGSMVKHVSGSIQAVHISMGMALYCSSKIPEGNPFHKKYIQFCSEGKLMNWDKLKFSQMIKNRFAFDGAIGRTRIDRALDSLLEVAKWFSLSREQMPTMLIIVSDMQFHKGVGHGGAEVERALSRWVEAGYDIPKVVYWNTAGYAGSPDTKHGKNIALVSGFSPAILKFIFAGDDLTPLGVMRRTLEKYQVARPE